MAVISWRYCFTCYGGLILGSSQFLLLQTQLSHKIPLTSNVIKNDPKIITSLLLQRLKLLLNFRRRRIKILEVNCKQLPKILLLTFPSFEWMTCSFFWFKFSRLTCFLHPRVNFTNILQAAFLYERLQSSFSVLTL